MKYIVNQKPLYKKLQLIIHKSIVQHYLLIMRLTFIILLFFTVSTLFSQESKQDNICPIEIVKMAVELDSIELLKTAYSSRMIDKISSAEEWEKGLKYWKTLDLENYSCEIDQKKSRAIFFYKGKQQEGKMRVIMEKSSWKFNER